MRFFQISALVTLLALNAAPCVCMAQEAEEAAPAKPRVVSVKQALTQPGEYKDDRVLLVGRFMGYNGSCNSAPPVGAGDIMIQDRQGLCIYANGPLPESYNAFEKKGLGENITLSGFVMEQEKGGAPFFLIPYTKQTRKNAPVNARALLIMRRADSQGKVSICPIERLFRTPDKYMEKPVVLKGVATDSADACTTLSPAPEEPGRESWIMASSDARCLRIVGPRPEAASTDNEKKALATVRGYLYKNGEDLLFLAVEDEPEIVKETVIKMNSGDAQTEPSPESSQED